MVKNLLGKAELLHWAHQQSSIAPCAKYDDLKDGLIFLSILQQLFPRQIDESIVKQQRLSTRNPKLNWELMKSTMTAVNMPVHLCDRKGVAAGHQKPCYNLLVMLYFLTKLSSSSEFSVDFAHPIDERLAAFLQSPDSLRCLAGGNPNLAENDTGAPSHNRSLSPAHPVSSPISHSEARGTPRISRHEEPPAMSQPLTPGPTAAHSAGGAAADVGHHQPRWSSTSTQEHGEVIIARLRADLNSMKRERESLVRELGHVRAVSQHTIEQQRTLVESEIARSTEQFHAQITSLKLESEHNALRVFEESRAQLERLEDDLNLEKTAATFNAEGGSRGPDALRAENADLRQRLAVAEGKLQNAAQREEHLQQQMRVQRENLSATRSQFEKLTKTLESTVARAHSNVTPDALVDSLSIAEQQPIVMRIRELQLEIDGHRAADARREEELKRLRERGAGEASAKLEAAFDTNAEIARLKSQVDRMRVANDYLQERLQRAEGSGSGGGSGARIEPDYHPTPLQNSLSAPSVGIGSRQLDDIAGQALRAVKECEPFVGAEKRDLLSTSFWDLVTATNTLKARLLSTGKTLAKLDSLYSEATKAALLERCKREQEVNEMKNSLSHQSAEAEMRHQAQLSQAQMESRLERDEVLRSRHDTESAVNRMQAMAASVLQDCERQISEVKDKNTTLMRRISHLESNERLQGELIELMRNQRHGQYQSGHSQQMQEGRMQQITQQLQTSGASSDKVYTLSGQETDATVNVKEAITMMRRHLDEAMAEVKLAVDRGSKMHGQLQEQRLEAEKKAAESRSAQERATQAEATVEKLRVEVERQLRIAAEAQAGREAAEHTFATVTKDLETFCEQAVGIVGKRVVGAGGGSNSSALRRSFDEASDDAHGDEPHTPPPHAAPTAAGGVVRVRASDAFIQPKSREMFSSSDQSSPIDPAPSASRPGGARTPAPRDETTPGGAATRNSPARTRAATVTAAAASVLSPNELERRKHEILSRYGVKM